MIKLKIKPKVSESALPTIDEYQFLLGICSDGLYVLNKEQTRIIDVIVSGNSKSCTVCSAIDEDTFLDAINSIKKMLSAGYNPLNVIQFD